MKSRGWHYCYRQDYCVFGALDIDTHLCIYAGWDEDCFVPNLMTRFEWEAL
jgi:hypothetical protein